LNTTLTKGANAPLPSPLCRVHLVAEGVPIDVCAVLLGFDGRVRSDEDLVFFHHPAQSGVELTGRTITADLAEVPADVERIALVAALDREAGGAASFSAGAMPRAEVECGGARLVFEPPPLTGGETAALLVEVYRRAGAWKVRAVGQGWATGLAGLATDFGVVVDDPGPAGPPARPVAAPAGPTPEPPRHVVLAKSGSGTLPLRGDDPGGTVTAALEWDGGSARRRSAGADLDLYALSVPRHQVTERGQRARASDLAVYYRMPGSLTGPPFIALDGDAREPGRETVTITRPDLQGYVLLCAYSAVENGVGSFRSYGARVTVTDPTGSTVTAPLFSTRAHAYWVAVALIDFTVPEGVRIEHVEQYSGRHVEARPTLYSHRTFRMGTGPVEFKTLPVEG
jgi:stress response protein SCP2/uncharacterized protein involved in tellurium resistance